MIARNPKRRYPFKTGDLTLFVRAPRHFEIEEIQDQGAEFFKTLPSANVIAKLESLKGDDPEEAERFMVETGIKDKQLEAIIGFGRHRYTIGRKFIVGWEGLVDDEGAPVSAIMHESGERISDESMELLPPSVIQEAGTYVVNNLCRVSTPSVGK